MEIKIEKLIEIIVREVISELIRNGVSIDYSSELQKNTSMNNNQNKKVCRELLDLKGYRTPVLTEDRILSLNAETVEIVIPTKTIITPGARDIIKKRKILISHK